MADLPPNLSNTAASAIVRHAEEQKSLETIAQRQRADEERRRQDAMREAEARKRQAETSGR